MSATDPLVFTATALALVVVACGATYLLARRAARTNPLDAMRAD